MNAAEFLTNFGELTNAPGGVTRLREMIFSMAVRGHLVPHDSQVPAIVAGRDFKLIEKDEIIDAEKYVFLLPENWTWARFEWLGEIHGGLTPSMSRSEFWDGDIPWVSPKDMHTAVIRGSEMRVTAKALDQTSLKLVPSGSILFVTRSGILRRTLPVALTGVTCVVNQDLKVLIPHNSSLTPYLLILMKGFEALILTQLVKTGTTVQSLIFDSFRKKPFPLPPLAEQKRIVSKVNELMALCDQLEAQQQERERRFPVLSRTCHARFAEAPTPNNLDRIFDETGIVSPDDLRSSIRTLAVRGKLVKQDAKDDPAAMLLSQISAQKAELAKQSKLRGPTSVNALRQDEGPYELPPTWVWVRFGSIMINRDGERVPVSKEERETKAKTYDYYGASGVIDKIDGYLFDKPLLLIGEDGANLINRSTPIAFIARGKYWVNNHAHVLDGITEEFLRYVELHINAINLEPYVTGTAQPKMNQAKMNSIPIALPPLAEQHRILGKVDELMVLVDQLQAQQQERDKLAEAFAKACVASFTGTTQLERPEKMKALEEAR